MTEETDRFKEFVGEQGEGLRKAWEGLPEKIRVDMLKAVDQLPLDRKGWRWLIESAIEHLKWATGEKQRVAIVGPANAGKSTLFNRLIRSKDDRAQVSAVPGTTRVAQIADAGIFEIIDTPGADAVGPVGQLEKERALAAADQADVLVVIYDASHGVRAPEKALFQDLKSLQKPMVVGLNKMDLIGRERATVLGKVAATLGLDTEQVIPLSALKDKGVERVLIAIAKSEPAIIAALGAALPAYRRNLVQLAVGRAATTAAGIAITPLPLLDFIPLVGVQAAMVLGIARIYAYKITLARARELVAAFGAGVLARTIFHEFAKLGGPPGWLLSAGIAAGTTAAIGYASAVWFESGEKISKDVFARTSRQFSDGVVERLKTLGKRKPGKERLAEKVSDALEQASLPGEIFK